MGSSNLPPGCGKLPGEEESMMEAFEEQFFTASSPEEQKLLESETILNMVDRAFTQGHAKGREDQKDDDGLYMNYVEDKFINKWYAKELEARMALADIIQLTRRVELGLPPGYRIVAYREFDLPGRTE